MRRIVQPTRVVFIQRNLGWSALWFASGTFGLVLAAGARERPADPTSADLAFLTLLGSGALFAAAFALLFRKRAYVVDHADRTLTVLHQKFLSGTKFSCPLDQVCVVMEQKRLVNTHRGGSFEAWVGSIWLEIPGREKVPFLGDLRGSDARALAERLADDLGRPLSVIERSDW